MDTIFDLLGWQRLKIWQQVLMSRMWKVELSYTDGGNEN